MLLKFLHLILILVVPGIVLADVVGGSWHNSLYYYQDQLDTLHPDLNYYENLNLYVKKIKATNLSFYSNINSTNRFQQKTHRKANELSHLYLDWNEHGGKYDWKIGRFGFFEGIAPIFLDGAQAGWNVHENWRLSAVAGLQTPSRFSRDYIHVKKDSSSQVYFLKVAGNPWKKTQLGLSYQHGIKGNDAMVSNVNLTGNQIITKKIHSSGMLGYEINEAKVNEFLLQGFADVTKKIQLGAQVSLEDHTVDSSLFRDTLIYGKHYEAGLNARYFFLKNADVMLSYDVRWLNDWESSHQVNCWLNWNMVFLKYRQDFGEGGECVKADAGLHVWRQPLLRVSAFVSGMRYQFSILDDESQHVWMGSLRIGWKPFKLLQTNIELQEISNKYYDYDTRVYVSTRMSLAKFYTMEGKKKKK
ncbi:MAG: hypothetical protein HQK83_10630 [Fibrobacteria bacterium]|nr:hypothetical protein [Fibrobacteria bacterium]